MSGTAPMTLQPPQKASTKHWPGCMSANMMGRMSLIILAFDPKYFMVIVVNKKENPAPGFPLVSFGEAYIDLICVLIFFYVLVIFFIVYLFGNEMQFCCHRTLAWNNDFVGVALLKFLYCFEESPNIH